MSEVIVHCLLQGKIDQFLVYG